MNCDLRLGFLLNFLFKGRNVFENFLWVKEENCFI